jgi:hypothetical protein
MALAQTIDEVILALTEIIETCKNEQSRLGYFPALYRRVTDRVKVGIAEGRFEDGARMERLDVTFAGRYLEAWSAWREGRGMSACWRIAFEAGDRWRPVILQHLLSGMNAHINFDLAIAAAETCPGAAIEGLKPDFDRINQLLADLVGPVEQELAEVSPWIGSVETFGGHAEDSLLSFNIGAARTLAWEQALRLAALQRNGQEVSLALTIRGTDAVVTGMGELILHPGPRLQAGLLLVRAREESDAVKVIAALAQNSGNT